ncbi:Aryl hydrocarbon receptor [Gryllus bimaculatus]|nr:Aryl hydrocarbon receptor [Gryllus bimaculatus]
MCSELCVLALNGFLLILTCEGEVFFATHSIESYLGFHQGVQPRPARRRCADLRGSEAAAALIIEWRCRASAAGLPAASGGGGRGGGGAPGRWRRIYGGQVSPAGGAARYARGPVLPRPPPPRLPNGRKIAVNGAKFALRPTLRPRPRLFFFPSPSSIDKTNAGERRRITAWRTPQRTGGRRGFSLGGLENTPASPRYSADTKARTPLTFQGHWLAAARSASVIKEVLHAAPPPPSHVTSLRAGRREKVTRTDLEWTRHSQGWKTRN